MSKDRTVKVYDIVGYDMIVMLRLSFVPGAAEWCFKVSAWAARLTPAQRCPPCMAGVPGTRACLWGTLRQQAACSAALPLQPGDAKAKLAISDSASGSIHLFDVRSGSQEPYAEVKLHAAPVTAMRYSAGADTMVSADQKGGRADQGPGPGGGGADARFGWPAWLHHPAIVFRLLLAVALW
jgi:peptidylprolyl isomerase domain and WD repeat-containing protein 1